MGDWPATLTEIQNQPITTLGLASLVGDASIIMGGVATGAAWGSANRALYIPFMVEQSFTAAQIAFEVTVQSGNCDVGIYGLDGTRLVSKGSTAVGGVGIQIIDITDTPLAPGVYYLAMNIDNTTANIVQSNTSGMAALWRVCGVQQQAVGAVTLPNPATFAAPAGNNMPFLTLTGRTTI